MKDPCHLGARDRADAAALQHGRSDRDSRPRQTNASQILIGRTRSVAAPPITTPRSGAFTTTSVCQATVASTPMASRWLLFTELWLLWYPRGLLLPRAHRHVCQRNHRLRRLRLFLRIGSDGSSASPPWRVPVARSARTCFGSAERSRPVTPSPVFRSGRSCRTSCIGPRRSGCRCCR
jgi:hypothetical protein